MAVRANSNLGLLGDLWFPEFRTSSTTSELSSKSARHLAEISKTCRTLKPCTVDNRIFWNTQRINLDCPRTISSCSKQQYPLVRALYPVMTVYPLDPSLLLKIVEFFVCYFKLISD
ncbi:hypothetical protein GJ496_001553 [Pomphorhynchus laevis]|nr:hypothetical protein GJ496_001553 [Pomphorhynchus laevis]